MLRAVFGPVGDVDVDRIMLWRNTGWLIHHVVLIGHYPLKTGYTSRDYVVDGEIIKLEGIFGFCRELFDVRLGGIASNDGYGKKVRSGETGRSETRKDVCGSGNRTAEAMCPLKCE